MRDEFIFMMLVFMLIGAFVGASSVVLYCIR